MKPGTKPHPHYKVLDQFSNGICYARPFWNHLNGYWKASWERSEQTLFMRYNEHIEDTVAKVKKMVEFLRHPFIVEEEKQGVVEDIIGMCRFENLSNSKVNREVSPSIVRVDAEDSKFSQVVRDRVNHILPAMLSS